MKNRLKAAYHYLMGINMIINQQDLADKMKYSRTSISKALNGYDDYLTENFMTNLGNTFPDIFNSDWLMKGTGEMLKNNVNINSVGRDMAGTIVQQGNNIGGHNLNIADPAVKKIIEGDRIEVTREDCAGEMYLQKINGLKTEIEGLKATLKAKDDAIVARDRTIDALQRTIDILSGNKQGSL
jgi:hypothetical protein